MQIVFIFHLSWPDKYFNQPCLPVFPAKLVFCKSLKSTSRVIRVSHSLQPSPVFLLLRFFASLLLSFEYLNYKYLSICVCVYCKILIPLVECAIENNHNDLTDNIVDRSIVYCDLIRFAIEMRTRVPRN